MADNTTISAYDISAPPMFRLVESGDSTIIQDYATSTPLWRVNGKIGGGVEVMTHDERVSIIPAVGDLIYDTSDHNLYVGDGMTVGGVLITNSDLETRVDALEIAVGIIEEGGEVVQGGFFCGDWTDENVGAINFGAWTQTV